MANKADLFSLNKEAKSRLKQERAQENPSVRGAPGAGERMEEMIDTGDGSVQT